MCFERYITIDERTASKSGLFFTDLTGCTVRLLDDLTKDGHDDYTDCFDYLYKKAQMNLNIDVQRKLATRFHIDKKQITRETSEFKADFNTGSELAGVKISVPLSKYSRIQIISIGVNSANEHGSPEAEFFVYKKDADGDLLSTISSELTEGKNTIDVYEDFEEEELFIAYNPEDLELKETKNRYYHDNLLVKGYSEGIACSFPCAYGDLGTVIHVNGGGLNVKFILYCSMEKLICENLPLFSKALLYRIGVDTMKERIATQNVNRTSVLNTERAAELMALHNDDYQTALDAATMNIRFNEDGICFLCKSTIRAKNNLP